MRVRQTIFISTMLFSVLLMTIGLPQNSASAQVMPTTIPPWFHYKALLWANGQISDQDFLSAVSELVSGQHVTNSSSSTNAMGEPPGTGNAYDSLLSAMGQMLYCNSIQGMSPSPDMMSGMENCNIQGMAGLSVMSDLGSGSGTSPSVTSGVPSNCINTQGLPGQPLMCAGRPTLFSDIENIVNGMSGTLTFDYYTQGIMNRMSGTPLNPNMLVDPGMLAKLAGVLSSGTLTSADYVKYFGSPLLSSSRINTDLQYHEENCKSMNFPTVQWAFCDHSGTNLNHAHLSDSDLTGVDLSGANLYKSDLVDAHLNYANLTSAQMENSDFSGADMSGIQMVNTYAPSSTFRLVTLNGANMTGANLKQSTMAFSTMERVSFKGANLNGAEMLQSDLKGSDFRGADLKGASFSYSDLTGANFDGDDLAGVDLGSAILTGASLHCINNPICK